MNYSTPNLPLVLPEVPCLIDLQALLEDFFSLKDARAARGTRYPLPFLLLLLFLAKLAGQDGFEQTVEWAKAQLASLISILTLRHQRIPHPVTFSRVLGEKLDLLEFERVLSRHFAGTLPATLPAKGSLIMSIDGKTLRGTITPGHTQGVHLMAAYLPKEGLVLAQVEVGSKANEIVAAPKLLKLVDLRGVVVTGDAMQAQRELSVQIVGAGGDYLWLVKANQPGFLEEIEQLFSEPPASELGAGFSAVPTDFEQAQAVEKGHGRIERRTVTVSSMLEGYSYWPHLGQVFKLEREWQTIGSSKVRREVRYGVTSLRREEAKPRRIMVIARAEWGIENELHWVRDQEFGEDASQIRRGKAPQVVAIVNNAIIGLLRMGMGRRKGGAKNLAQARRQAGFKLNEALFKLNQAQPKPAFIT